MSKDTKLQRRAVPMSKIVRVAVVLGFINGAIAAGVTYYLNSRASTDVGAFRAWSDFAIWLWPPGIMMMVTDHADSAGFSQRVSGAVVLLFSLAANAGLYGLAGVVIEAVWKKLRAATSSIGRV